MTDIHTHILHAIDDGADSIEVSKSMLQIMSKAGVDRVVCTPHFDFTNVSPEDFLQLRDTRMSELSSYARESNIELVRGCELRLTSRILNLDSIGGFCIGDTRNVLIEMPFSKDWTDSCFDLLTNFIDYFNVRPVIAHVERYNPVIKNIKTAEKLIELGAVLQLDASSLFEKQYSKTAKKLLKYEMISVVASDCHNTESRSPEVLSRAFNEIDRICKNGARNYLNNFANSLCK